MSDNLSVGSLYPPNEHTGVAFHGSNSRTVLLITSDGRLEKGPGYSTEEAAQVLFDAVSDHIAGVWKQTRDENAALREQNENLASLLFRVLRKLDKNDPLRGRCLDYLKKIGRTLNPFRSAIDAASKEKP